MSRAAIPFVRLPDLQTNDCRNANAIGSYLVVTDGVNIPVDIPNEIPTARLFDVQYECWWGSSVSAGGLVLLSGRKLRPRIFLPLVPSSVEFTGIEFLLMSLQATGRSIGHFAEYFRKGAACLAQAQLTDIWSIKVRWLRMARTWFRLAEKTIEAPIAKSGRGSVTPAAWGSKTSSPSGGTSPIARGARRTGSRSRTRMRRPRPG